jgi:hypothetical protein
VKIPARSPPSGGELPCLCKTIPVQPKFPSLHSRSCSTNLVQRREWEISLLPSAYRVRLTLRGCGMPCPPWDRVQDRARLLTVTVARGTSPALVVVARVLLISKHVVAVCGGCCFLSRVTRPSRCPTLSATRRARRVDFGCCRHSFLRFRFAAAAAAFSLLHTRAAATPVSVVLPLHH